LAKFNLKNFEKHLTKFTYLKYNVNLAVEVAELFIGVSFDLKSLYWQKNIYAYFLTDVNKYPTSR